MKKIYTLSVMAIAMACAGSAYAQSAAELDQKSKAQSPANNAPAQTVVVRTSTQAKSAQVAAKPVRAEDKKMQAAREEVAAYEAKINANRNNPNFDVKAAEAELQRLKVENGIK